MPFIKEPPHEQPSYPALLLFCPRCKLLQLGLIVDPKILFPKNYPYTSGTTKILRDNFAELAQECQKIIQLKTHNLVVDIGSNDGTLLQNFKPFTRVLGITPEDIGKRAIKQGIPTMLSYFDRAAAKTMKQKFGKANIITAANVFAHIEDVHGVIENISFLLEKDGVFISESHYVHSLLKTLQYDTIYHEHLRYYSLTSLSYLLRMHGFKIIHAKKIPSHGGSIRVYATRSKKYRVRKTVSRLLDQEKRIQMNPQTFHRFKKRVVQSKLQLLALLHRIKKKGGRIYGISAPSRASTLIHYVGIDDGILDCVLEIKGSQKIGKYIPGTLIPVVEESKLYRDQPEYALILSWHIAKELAPKLRQKGYKGKFIIPLPSPRILR